MVPSLKFSAVGFIIIIAAVVLLSVIKSKVNPASKRAPEEIARKK
jgi:hypothetical protein